MSDALSSFNAHLHELDNMLAEDAGRNRRREVTYDPKCLELARHFLPEIPASKLTAQLAQWIQEGVEKWIEDERSWRALSKAARGCARIGPGCDWPDCPCAGSGPSGGADANA